ncbi:MAG: hypothetical protein NC308_05040 [Clostridium sp.]|nr:hypothetical protein [Bacteroides sp.]MCM1198234.1 hypothetical protein [Clostridium sp.]
MIYLGANIGIAALTYSEVNTITEQAVYQSSFSEYRFQQYYDVTGVGVYGKFGIIATPYKGLRLGAAIQTPTSNSMKQLRYMTAVKDSNSEMRTYDAIWTYRLTSPMRFNIGAAYTFGSLAMVSADYEVCDYNSMKMTGRKYSKNADFHNVNSEIGDMMGASHMVRAGIEINPIEWFSIRAGYGFTSKPGYYIDGNDNKRRLSSVPEANSHKYSFGIGYTNKEFFYIDLSFTARHYGSEYITPYTMARRNSNGQIVTDNSGRAVPDYDASPCIYNNKWLWVVTYTLGYRF